MMSKRVKNFLLSSLFCGSLLGMTDQPDEDGKQVVQVQRESAVVTGDQAEHSGDGNAIQIGDATLVFSMPTDRALQARAASAETITVHVAAAGTGQGHLQIEDKSSEEGWCGKIKNCLSRCFSRCRRPHNTPPNRCAYIFYKNRCFKIIFSAAITTIPAAASVYGATRFLDVFLRMGGNTAIITEMFLGGFTYTAFLIATQMFICSLCEGCSCHRIWDGFGMSILSSIPATAIRMWFYMYPMTSSVDSTLIIPVIVYNCAGALYISFGVYKETCSPQRNIILGKPLSDCLKIVFKDPFNAVQNSMQRKVIAYERAGQNLGDQPFPALMYERLLCTSGIEE